MSRLEAQNVGHRYGDGPWLFRGVSLRVDPGALIAITGPSGSGKSTLLAALGGLLNPTEGEIVRGDATFAWVYQSASGIPRRTALDHVVYPLLAVGLSRSEAETEAHPILARVGLERHTDSPYATLSGGEAQRLALAQAIATGRTVILADEPTAQLDRATARTIAEAISQLADGQRAVVVATHDPLVMEICPTRLDLATASHPPPADRDGQ